VATLTDLQILEDPPAMPDVDCEGDCGGANKATRTLAHWMKYKADIVAARRKGESGAVYAAHLCPDCKAAYMARIAAENRAAHDKCLASMPEDASEAEIAAALAAAVPHGGFTDMPLQVEG
jgi:hypothetical protein